jgi:hypothetical protein
MSCSWCHIEADEHGEFCNECEFCHANICCECWDGDDTCYYPGEGYCPTCKSLLEKCPTCVAYIIGLMREPVAPMCDKHWEEDSPEFVGNKK